MSAKIIILLMGVYMVGGGAALLLSPARVTTMVEGIGDQPMLSYITGAILAPLGAAILLGFHDFSSFERGIVTVIGLGMLIEGWFLMALPKTFMSFARPFLISSPLTQIMGALTLVIAAAAIWYGLPR